MARSVATVEAPPLLAQREPNLQVILGVVVPSLFGLVTGIVLGISEPVYLVLSLLGILGGLAAGYEHADGAEGAARGLAGGALFGTFILFGHAVHGGDPKVHLPEPHVLLVVITTSLGVLLGGIGGRMRGRRLRAETLAATAE